MSLGPEDKIQRDIVRVVRLVYPKSLLFAVPNGGFRFKTTSIILKLTGVMAGVSDLIFLHMGQIIFIEVKTEKGAQTDYQKEFQKKVEAMGFKYWLVRSAADTLNKIASC